VAARLWWLLRWLGHNTVAVLDGGLAKWRKEQRPLTSVAPAITPTVYEATVDDTLWVQTSVVERLLTQHAQLLVDARAAPRFKGAVEPIDKVAGHIPGAINRPFESNVDAQGCFLERDALRTQFQHLLQGKEPAQVINMCGSGVTACHNILAMDHAGLPGAKLYVGSWSEWIRDSRRPVAKEA
jgi:thiosulfate/3-mercaptopyruvate sulfurtransferase